MTVRYDPRTEWAREDHQDAVARARRAVARAVQPAGVDLAPSGPPLLLGLARMANTPELGAPSHSGQDNGQDSGRDDGQEASW